MLDIEFGMVKFLVVLGAAHATNLFISWFIHFVQHQDIFGIPLHHIHLKGHHEIDRSRITASQYVYMGFGYCLWLGMIAGGCALYHLFFPTWMTVTFVADASFFVCRPVRLLCPPRVRQTCLPARAFRVVQSRPGTAQDSPQLLWGDVFQEQELRLWRTLRRELDGLPVGNLQRAQCFGGCELLSSPCSPGRLCGKNQAYPAGSPVHRCGGPPTTPWDD